MTIHFLFFEFILKLDPFGSVLQHLKSEGGTRRRPKRRSTLQSEKLDDRNSSPMNNHPQNAEPKQKKVKSKKSSEIDDSLNHMKKEEKIDLADFPFFSDDEVKYKKRRDLDPLPPKRKRQRRKSLFCGPRRLQTEEFEGGNKFSLSSLYFWDTLGETRPKSDDFSWGRPIGYRRHMGRVYYDSFELSGELFNVGNFVMIDNSSLYKLISAFQATKSFVGRWNSPKDEIQTRGYIYVELAPMQQDVENTHICFLEAVTEWNPDHVEGAPIQVLSNSGKSCDLKNVVVECTAVCESTLKSSRKGNIKTIPFDPKQRELVTESDPFILVSQYALDSWPEIINAKFVVLYGNEREFKLGENEGYTAFESDDSDGFDETSCKHFMKGKINWNNELECDTITKRKEAMVMYTGSIKVEKEVNAKSLHGIFKELNPLLDKSIQFDESLENTVESLRKELLFRTATARLGDYFVLKQVPRIDKGGIIKEFAVEIGFNRYKSKIQQLACEHSIKCQDTVMIAPCGSGKSMVFVQAALRSGGVSIVIEPLNAIIKSQLRELKYLSPHISMEQLLSEEEAKHQRSPSSINRLQIIINEVKVGP
jgi:DEAD/DEAH box helicase